MLASKQIAFGKAAGAAKPYKARLEYLESTGTQYIVTDYVPNDNSVAELDFQAVGELSSLMGVYSASAKFNLGVSTGNKNWFGGIGASNTVSITELADTSRRVLVLDAPQKMFSVSGVGSWSCGSGSVSGNSERFNLFARYFNGDGKNLLPARLYGVKFKEMGETICSLIPVLDNADTPCMYDEVRGEFFYNQGTGEFIAGPEITEE